MAKRKKKFNKLRNFLLLLGAVSLGTFAIIGFSRIYGWLMANSNMVLLVTGGIVLALILIGILSPKKVRKSIFGSMGRLKA